MSKHLWYLSEELVGLALFDDNVSYDVKDRMVEAIFNKEGDEEPPKRAIVSFENSKDKSVADFTTKNTKLLFTKLNLAQGFLSIPASQWEGNKDYQSAEKKVKALTVINDHAERGVALIQEFSGRLTKDEDQLQYILQIVADHRKKYLQVLKTTLAKDTEFDRT